MVEEKRIRTPCQNFPVAAQWDRSNAGRLKDSFREAGFVTIGSCLRGRGNPVWSRMTPPSLHPISSRPGRSPSERNGTPGWGQGHQSRAVDNNKQELIWAASTLPCRAVARTPDSWPLQTARSGVLCSVFHPPFKTLGKDRLLCLCIRASMNVRFTLSNLSIIGATELSVSIEKLYLFLQSQFAHAFCTPVFIWRNDFFFLIEEKTFHVKRGWKYDTILI